MGDRITAPTVAAIGGSERVGGNTDQVLDRLVRLLDQRGVTTTVIQLRDLDMTGGRGACGDCNTRDVHCGVQDGVSAAVQTMRSAPDGTPGSAGPGRTSKLLINAVAPPAQRQRFERVRLGY